MSAPVLSAARPPSRPARLLAGGALGIALGACALAPGYQPPAMVLPTQWSPEQVGDAAAAAPMDWAAFGSAQLPALIQQALGANHELAAAVQRIEQARQSSRVAKAALLPSASAAASASRSRQEQDDRSQIESSDEVQLGLSYELDLWGARASALDAAQARLAASAYSRDATALTLQAAVASTYFSMLALDERIAIAGENLRAGEELLRLVQLRFDAGAATALELAQQRSTLLGIRASIPALEQSRRATRNALAVLLGRAPQDFAPPSESLSALSRPTLALVQPAALLQRRPDIRLAEANLIAANADIGSARAALYPSLGLSAAAGASGLITGGSGTVASLAASLSQSIFDGGARRAQLALNQAQRQELAETYVQTVLQGFQDVENQLSAVDRQAEREQWLEANVVQAREADRLARIRYAAGQEDLLTLLDSQRSLLTAQDSLVQARLARLDAVIGLYQALGGGWVGTRTGFSAAPVSAPPG